MNPLDLRGPEFLLFYLAFAAVVVTALALLRRQLESGDPPKLPVVDPYLIAYVRGGANEALRVATISLIDRGLLEVHGDRLVRVATLERIEVRRPIERALLDFFAPPSSGLVLTGAKRASEMYRDSKLDAACESYRHEAERLRLLPDESWQARRIVLGMAAIVLLAGLGFTKIWVALERGHRNIGFLLVEIALAVFCAVWVLARRQTTIGARFVADIREMLDSLRRRASVIRAGGRTQELALLAGVFGVAALPEAVAPYRKKLFPRIEQQVTSSCGSSCGSACGTGCGGGGGGCGGGGCGGGGCGGCGA